MGKKQAKYTLIFLTLFFLTIALSGCGTDSGNPVTKKSETNPKWMMNEELDIDMTHFNDMFIENLS